MTWSHSEGSAQEVSKGWTMAVLVALAALYGATGTEHLLGGDHAEFATIAAGGGIAHPPGYPVFSMYLRLAGDSLRATSWLQVPWMLLAVALLMACARKLGASAWSSLTVGVWFALSPLAWVEATHAEVFAMNTALAAGVMYVCAAAESKAKTVLLGALFGLGAAHHHTLSFLLPLALLASWRPTFPQVLTLAFAALPILMVPVLAEHGVWAWGNPSQAGYTWHMLFRRDYGSFSLSALSVQSSVGERLWFFAKQGALGSAGLMLLGLLGASEGMRRRDARNANRRKAWWVGWGASWLAAGPLMALLLTIPLTGTGPQVAKRFLLLPLVLVTPWAALALDGVRERRARAFHSLVGIGLSAWLGWIAVQEHHRPMVEQGLSETLAAAPKDAILLGGGDHRLFGFLYLQKIEHRRPDVTYLHVGLLGDAWYRERLGLQFDPSELKQQVRTWLAEGRPVLVLDAGILPRLDVTTYPEGTWLRAMPPGSEVPTPVALESLNLVWTSHHDLQGELSADPTTWAAAIQDDYARPYLALMRAYERQGDKAAATRNHARVKHYAPWFH